MMTKLSLFATLLFVCFAEGIPAQQVTNPATNIPTSVVTPPAVTVFPGLANLSGITKYNYVRTQIPDEPVTTLPASGMYYRQTTDYFDGLGRPLQTVQQKGQADGYDLVQHHVYDGAGRERYQYLPYAFPDSTGVFHPSVKSNIQAFYSTSTGQEPYSKTDFDNSPLNRVMTQYSPGHSWIGSARGVKYEYRGNDLNEDVRIWTIGNTDTATPVATTKYAANTLNVTVITDEDGKKSYEYKDKLGRVIFTKKFLIDNHSPSYGGYACTYYVYNDLNQLRYVITPQAVSLTGPVSPWYIYSVKELCYSYFYDNQGRMIEKKLPGKEVEYYVYDKRDRPVFYQDGNLRAQGKWAFTFYDALDRPTVTGLRTITASRATLVNVINNANLYTPTNWYYFVKNYDLWHVYPADNLSGCYIRSFNYYDDYSDGDLSSLPFNSAFFPTSALPTVVPSVLSNQTRGLLTGTRVRVKDPDNPTAMTWSTTVNYYDDKGLVIQSQNRNLRGGLDITSDEYYFQGAPYRSITRHQNPLAKKVNPAATDVLTEITLEKTYARNFGDNGGNDLVASVKQSINGGQPYDLAAYTYNHLNQPVTQQYTIGTVLKDYNLKGWLTHINAAIPPSTADHFFEENLFYDQGFASKLYNGNIAGITWSGFHTGTGAIATRAYGYSYDNLDRLTHAEFRQFKPVAPTGWNKDIYDYTASNMTYDMNGNLLSMDQRGVTTGPTDMDKLTYTYAPNSNQLVKVKDLVSPANTVGLPDFKDSADLVTEYEYDANGNLLSDDNKKITAIAYNDRNKPERITLSGGRILTYVYDANGNRLRKKVVDPGNTTIIYDYIGNFVYKDNVLQYILNEEGRARPVANDSTNYATRFVYDYFIKDHLGNVRSTVTANPVSPVYLASHEIASANIEQLFFDNIPSVRADKPGSTDPQDHKAALLVASDPDRRIGTSIMLRVMPGDNFDISADAYYEGEYQEGETTDASSVIESLMGTLLGGINYDGVPLSELPANVRTIEQTLGNPALAGQLNNLLDQNDDPQQPRAHLNYLVFDNEMHLVAGQSGAVQVPLGANGGWTHLQPGIVTGSHGHQVGVSQPGYIIVYIDNQSIGQDVWFDNVHIEHYTSEVLEENHYMPYGLCISEDAGGSATSNNYKYQGITLNRDFSLETYETTYRDLDPQIGRFRQVDPKAELDYSISPFASMNNNPASIVDPMGDVPGDYYNENGKYLGSDGIDDNKAYTAESIKHVNGKNEFEGVKELPAGNDKIEKMAATVYAESSVGFGIEDPKEAYAIASTHMRNDLAFGAAAPLAKKFLKTEAKDRNETFMQTAIAGVINALKGGKDFSNGADQWDGAEQAMVSKANMDKPSNGRFMFKMNVMGWSMESNHYSTWKGAVNKKFGSGRFTVPQTKSALYNYGGMKNKGKIRLHSTAQYGLTIFWKTK